MTLTDRLVAIIDGIAPAVLRIRAGSFRCVLGHQFNGWHRVHENPNGSLPMVFCSRCGYVF